MLNTKVFSIRNAPGISAFLGNTFFLKPAVADYHKKNIVRCAWMWE